MTHTPALTDFGAEMLLRTLLRNQPYIVPFVIDVDVVADATLYSLDVNGATVSYTSGVGATKESILQGLEAALISSSEPVALDLFEDEEDTPGSDASKRLRVSQLGFGTPLSVEPVSANLTASQHVYIGLCETLPNETVQEIMGKLGYTREKATWALDGSREVELDQDVMFGAAQEEWGAITHYRVYDQNVGGNALLECQISVPKNVLTNDFFLFRATDLKVRLS